MNCLAGFFLQYTGDYELSDKMIDYLTVHRLEYYMGNSF